jgi:hypothetical protein
MKKNKVTTDSHRVHRVLNQNTNVLLLENIEFIAVGMHRNT